MRVKKLKELFVPVSALAVLCSSPLALAGEIQDLGGKVLSGSEAKSAFSVTNKIHDSISNRLNLLHTDSMSVQQGFWGNAFYNDAKNNSGKTLENTVIPNYTAKTKGLTLGYDVALENGLTLGAALSYAKTKFTYKNKGSDRKLDGNDSRKSYTGTVYTGWTDNDWFTDGMISYSKGKRKLDSSYDDSGTPRNVLADDKFGDSAWIARLTTGYNYQADMWTIQPRIEANLGRYSGDDLDTSADLAPIRELKTENDNVAELGAGVKFLGQMDVSGGKLMPVLGFSGFHNFKNEKQKFDLVYDNSGTKVVLRTPSPTREQNRYQAGLGLDYVTDSNVSMGVHYDYHWSGDYKEHSLMATVGYTF